MFTTYKTCTIIDYDTSPHNLLQGPNNNIPITPAVTMDDYFVDVIGKPASLACAVTEASINPTITWTDGTTTWDETTLSSASISLGETSYTAGVMKSLF